jgi:hypothetical protein
MGLFLHTISILLDEQNDEPYTNKNANQINGNWVEMNELAERVKWCMYDDLDSAKAMLNIATKWGWANEYLFISVVERSHCRVTILFRASGVTWLNTQITQLNLSCNLIAIINENGWGNNHWVNTHIRQVNPRREILCRTFLITTATLMVFRAGPRIMWVQGKLIGSSGEMSFCPKVSQMSTSWTL